MIYVKMKLSTQYNKSKSCVTNLSFFVLYAQSQLLNNEW